MDEERGQQRYERQHDDDDDRRRAHADTDERRRVGWPLARVPSSGYARPSSPHRATGPQQRPSSVRRTSYSTSVCAWSYQPAIVEVRRDRQVERARRLDPTRSRNVGRSSSSTPSMPVMPACVRIRCSVGPEGGEIEQERLVAPVVDVVRRDADLVGEVHASRRRLGHLEQQTGREHPLALEALEKEHGHALELLDRRHGASASGRAGSSLYQGVDADAGRRAARPFRSGRMVARSTAGSAGEIGRACPERGRQRQRLAVAEDGERDLVAGAEAQDLEVERVVASTGVPSTAVMMSPSSTPATSAGPPSTTALSESSNERTQAPVLDRAATHPTRAARRCPGRRRRCTAARGSHRRRACSMIGLARSIGQGEADAIGHARLGGRDADEVAVAVEDGATGVAGVDRGVGLDEVAQAAAAGPPPKTSMLRSRPLTMPIETLPGNWPSGLPIATARWPTRSVEESPSGRAGRSGRVHLDEREVGERVDAGDGAVQDGAVLEDDVDVIGIADDVAVRDDRARAGSMTTPEPVPPGIWNWPGSWKSKSSGSSKPSGQLEALGQQLLEIGRLVGVIGVVGVLGALGVVVVLLALVVVRRAASEPSASSGWPWSSIRSRPRRPPRRGLPGPGSSRPPASPAR